MKWISAGAAGFDEGCEPWVSAELFAGEVFPIVLSVLLFPGVVALVAGAAAAGAVFEWAAALVACGFGWFGCAAGPWF